MPQMLDLDLIVTLNLVSTLFMVGVIWVIQLVHYPLFDCVGTDQFVEYERQHTTRITFVVGPPMLIEAVTSLLMVLEEWHPPVPPWITWSGLLLVGLIWVSTAVLQVPCHNRLSQGFDPDVHKRLVRTNWLRTVLWTLRGILVVYVGHVTL